MKYFIAYPFYGELGWEIQNWVPHLRYIWQNNQPFDVTKAYIRPSRNGLYRDFISHFSYILGYEEFSEGNAFVLTKPDAYEHYKKHCRLVDEEVKKLESEGNEVIICRLPKSKYRYFRYKDRHKIYKVFKPRQEKVEQWKDYQGGIIFHLRHIPRSKKKNTPKELLHVAYNWAKNKGLKFTVVGQTLGLKPNFKIPGNNLLNKTTLDDLIALYSLSKFVVGSSSGPMHLAAFTKTPHIVWGGGRNDVKERYLKTWNPFQTPVCFLDLSFNISSNMLKKGLEITLKQVQNA